MAPEATGLIVPIQKLLCNLLRKAPKIDCSDALARFCTKAQPYAWCHLGGNFQLGKARRAALYVRVSTDHQSVENQVRELKEVAERRGWTVIEVYRDAGISGAKGRDKRPGLDAMLKDASRRRFDIVMVWAIDRLGRSLIDLLGTIEHLEKVGVDLYLDQQNIDTTTPTGRLLFQITWAFGEFERSMIRQRVRVGLNVIKEKIARDGKFTSKAGKVRGSWAGQGLSRTRSSARDRSWPRASASARWPGLLASVSARCIGYTVRQGGKPLKDGG
jgi:DNA invertase Pin-like site-specific DNA recombinase